MELRLHAVRAVRPVLTLLQPMITDSPVPPVALVAVINSFNRHALLREAMGALMVALRQAPELGGAVVVYEAGSTDGSREFLETWIHENPSDRLEIVTPLLGAGTSFSDGVNDGCAEALRRFPATRYLLLYETDNWINGPEPLRQAREVLEVEPGLAAVGWTVRKHTGTLTGYCMRFPTALALAAGPKLSMRWELETPRRVPNQRTPGGVEWWRCDVAFTSPLLIRRSSWEGAGGFDVAAFPFSDCDLDWAWRVRKLGLGGQGIIPTDTVVHDNRAQASAWSDDRMLKLHRARTVLLKRHRGWWSVNTIKPLLFLRHAAESVMLLAAKLRGRTAAPGKLANRLKMLRGVWRDYQG